MLTLDHESERAQRRSGEKETWRLAASRQPILAREEKPMPLSNHRVDVFAASVLAFGALTVGAFAQDDSPINSITPVTDEMLLNPPAEDWLMWRRTYDSWGYSPLDQINKDNVNDLRLAWAWSMSPGRTQETPIVHDGVMFIQNSDHTIQALNAATGELIWEHFYNLPD